MADSREFVLIGSFKDGITPALNSINTALTNVKRSIAGLSTKRGGYGEITKTMGSLVSAHKNLAASVREVKTAVSDAIPVLRQYKKEIGGVARAHFAIARATQQAARNETQFWNQATKSAQNYQRVANSAGGRRGARPMPSAQMSPPGGGGGGGGGGYRTPPSGSRRSGGSSSGGGAGDDFPMARFTLAFGLSQALSAPIESAIVSGFQVGVQLMMKPFEYFASAFGERVQDQLSDLKAAGALYSISKRAKNPFLKDIDEAIQFQQDTNRTFANLAKDLPGVTNDYVQVGKRLSDTAARIVQTDFQKSLEFAKEIREKEGGKYYGSVQELTTTTGGRQQREVIETILGNLTKKATLGGIGNRSGAGGISGAYGLPGIVERLISEEEVSVAKFQRYASVFSDPAIADALQRNVDKINATAKNSVERAKMLDKVLDEIVTPEMIEKLRTSVDGIYQGFKSAFMDPDTGLFGLGRQMEGIGKRLNQYGQYVNEAGEVVAHMSMAAKEDLSLFEILADIFANVGQVLMPIVDILPTIFDPLKGISNILLEVRHYAAEFNRTFNMYREGLKNLAKMPGKGFIKESVDIRASLMAITNILDQFGGLGKGQFEKISAQLGEKNLNVGKILSELLSSFLNSKIAKEIGKAIGQIIGTVISEVAKVTGFISGRIKSSSQFFKGLSDGFSAAGGAKAFGNIFKDVFTIMFNAFVEIAKIIPLEAYLVGALMLTLPVAIQTLAMAIAHKFADAVFSIGSASGMTKLMGGAGGAGGKGAFMRGLGGAFVPRGFKPKGKTQYTAPIGPLPRGIRDPSTGVYSGGGRTYMESGTKKRNLIRQKGVGGKLARGAYRLGMETEIVGQRSKAYPNIGVKAGENGNPLFQPGRKLVRQRGAAGGAARAMARGGKNLAGLAKGAGKFVPGAGALAFGAVDAGIRMAQGEDAGRALGGAAASVIGSTLGGILGQALIPIPGVGAAVGGIAGGIIGDRVFQAFAGPKDAQEAAAKAQAAAAAAMDRATEASQAKYLQESGALGGTEAISQYFGGGAGLLKALQDPAKVKSMGLSPEEIQQAKILAGYQTQLNTATQARLTAESKATAAEQANTNNKKQLRELADKAAKEQIAIETRMKKAWETTSTGAQTKLLTAAGSLATAINQAAAKIRGAGSVTVPGTGPTPPPGGKGIPTPTSPGGMAAPVYGGTPGRKMGLGDAIATEMKNKPKGSHLLIANSSETVIPASGGFSPLGAMGDALMKFVGPLQGLANMAGQAMSPGGPLGAATGSLGMAHALAKSMGLTMTSYKRSGPPNASYHNVGRAMDFSNSTGPTPQMMAFAQAMASRYGSRMAELIYTPLGFSIKNGQRVAPYAQGSHYNHVHVAFAEGYESGRMLTSQSKAEQWEKSMVPGSVKVSSITGNSAEGFGGGTTINGGISVTVNGSGVNDADQLAEMVALKIGQAVADARASSIFV